jgi:hypothetical protein
VKRAVNGADAAVPQVPEAVRSVRGRQRGSGNGVSRGPCQGQVGRRGAGRAWASMTAWGRTLARWLTCPGAVFLAGGDPPLVGDRRAGRRCAGRGDQVAVADRRHCFWQERPPSPRDDGPSLYSHLPGSRRLSSAHSISPKRSCLLPFSSGHSVVQRTFRPRVWPMAAVECAAS